MTPTRVHLPLLAVLLAASLPAQPIRLHPSNPHYFLFENKPTILITSAEHYGAVVNLDFDYAVYLDKLKAYGLNYTRIYPGFLFEPVGKFIKGNTLGPRPASLIVPWARSSTPGYMLGGNRFDLDRWDARYFSRLKDFVAKAAERGIVVEICFYNAQYTDTWPISPLYHENNIQGVGKCELEDAQTLKFPDLVRREEDYVRKIVVEVNSFDNVILEICDEPFLTGTPIALAGEWIGRMVEVIKAAESKLPKRHLIAQQVEGPVGGPCDFSAHPDVPLIVAQYLWEASAEQMGGLKALDLLYARNKPIELNETNYYPVWYRGDKAGASRVEAWEFIVGGGAGFNHLNGLYTVENPAGNSPENALILRALRSLKNFMNSFDFLKMRPDKSFLVSGFPADAFTRGMSERGQQYALYLHHSTGGKGSAYTVKPGAYKESLVLNLPVGDYSVDWVEPASGSVIRTEPLKHAGGNWTVTTPAYGIDLALRIKSQAARAAP